MTNAERGLVEIIEKVEGDDIGMARRIIFEGKLVVAALEQPGGPSFVDRIRASEFSTSTRQTWETAPVAVRVALTELLATSLDAGQQGQSDLIEKFFRWVPVGVQNEMGGLPMEVMSMLRELSPPTQLGATRVSLEEYRQRRQQKIARRMPELLVLTGLNGVGKTTAIEAIYDFAELAEIPFGRVKFPRADHWIGQSLRKVLVSDKPCNTEARQMIFLADVLDWIMESEMMDNFGIADRLPGIEGMVYADEIGRVLSLATLDMLPAVVTTIVLDRSVHGCQTAIKQRGTAPRILEREVQAMHAQRVRYWGLRHLDGTTIVNIEGNGNVKSDVHWSRVKVVETVGRAGVWQRRLLQQGRVSNLDKANELTNNLLDQWYLRELKRQGQ